MDYMNFVPFGFQYYRAPTPKRDCWEKDLSKLADEGFNCVKFWIQWRWNEPEKGKFDFSDIDCLMALADRFRLKVVLNIILDVAPIWFLKRYPDARMVTASEQPVQATPINCRQIGGAPGPCFHHKKGTDYRMRFVKACAKRYANHPALFSWDVWNEPTGGFNYDQVPGNILCFCKNSLREFGNWLQRKYGDIARLNERWGRNYRDFSQPEPPRLLGTTADFIDWRLFMIDTVTDDLNKRVDAVKQYDKAHPVMTHTVPFPIMNSVYHSTDDFSLSKRCDMFGNSVGSNSFAANLLHDSARGKKVFNSEVHMIPGSAICGHPYPESEEVLRHFLIPLAKGTEGFLIWQYRPETLGNEAPCWGSVTLRGQNTPWHEDCITVAAMAAKYNRLIGNRAPAKPQIGILFNPASELYVYAALGGFELFVKAMTGAYKGFHENNYDVVFLRDEDILAGRHADLDLICLPAAYYLNSVTVRALSDYTAAGGQLLVEPLAGMIDEQTGCHEPVIPGCGLSELCGLEQTFCLYENRIDWGKYADGRTKSMRIETSRGALSGTNFMAGYRIIGENTQVIGRFTDQSPALYINRYKKGRVITASASLFCTLADTDPAAFGLWIQDFVSHRQDIYRAGIPSGIRVDHTEKGNEGLIFIDNRTDKDYNYKISESLTAVNTLAVNERLEQSADTVTECLVPKGCIRCLYVQKKGV